MKNIKQDKKLLLEQLKKTPIIQIACEKLGVARPTFYRWKSKDKSFAKGIDEAILEGRLMVNDLAETNLISCIKEKNFEAAKYWLDNHHSAYSKKLQINHCIEEALSPEQEKIVREALNLMYSDDEEDNIINNTLYEERNITSIDEGKDD